MNDASENLCNLNSLIKNLNTQLRDCSKEDKAQVERTCWQIIHEAQQIKFWSIETRY